MRPRVIAALLKAIAILATAAAVTVTGCGDGSTTPDPDTAGLKIYRHSMDSLPSSLDPVQATVIYANFVALNAYDTLYTYKYLARPYEIKPNLAAALPEISGDGLTYTIPIKRGVRFVDDPAFPDGKGREVTTDDFVYSIKRHFDPATRPQGAWLWQGRIAGIDEWKAQGSDYEADIAGLEAVDPYTIRIRLTRPYPQLIYTLAMGFSAVVPREAVEHYGKEFAVRPVGSGPYRLIDYDTSRAVFEPNPNFREEPVDIWAEGYDPATQAGSGVEAIHGRSPPFLDRLEIHFIEETSARWSSFTKGDEIHFSGLPNEQVDRVLASKSPITLRPEFEEKYRMTAGPEAGFVYYAFNMDFPEFGYHPDQAQEERNHVLRCAIIKSFDWDARNESFYFGLGRVFPGVIVPVVPEFDPELPPGSVTRDVAGAKRLLAANGWNENNLPEFVYGTSAGVTMRLFYEQFRAWLIEIGYPIDKVSLKQYATYGDLGKAWRESRLPLIGTGWGLDYPDAENTLQLFYGPNGSPGSNSSNYDNPEYDQLFEQASVMLPSPERTEIYQRMNRMLIDDCVAMTGLTRTRVYLWHKDVIAVPDRAMVGGFFLKYVDVRLPESATGGPT